MRRTCTNLPPTPPGFVFSPQPASKRNGNVQIQFLHRKLVLIGSIKSISPALVLQATVSYQFAVGKVVWISTWQRFEFYFHTNAVRLWLQWKSE